MDAPGSEQLLTVEIARRLVLERAKALPPAILPLDRMGGLVLAEDVVADLDLPPFDKALVDGYAVRAEDVDPGRSLRVVAEIAAGVVPDRPIGPGEAAMILTGAPLPAGADAVVMFEHSTRTGETVRLDPPKGIRPGQNWLQRAREMSRGDVVLTAGQRLNPPRIGLLASVGRAEANVIPPPMVAIVPTGDELVPPGQVPGPGQIRDSNTATLRAMATAAGAIAEAHPIAPDEPGPLREALAKGLEADVLLITGGVSAGTRDLVPATLVDLGVVTVFHKVRLKPGKPLLFGVGPTRADGRPGALVFGLPGNPVSGVVGFLLFVRPALAILGGGDPDAEPPIETTLAAGFRHRGDRPTYHPARLSAGDGSRMSVTPLTWAGSADLRTVAAADGFAAFPAGDRDYEPGEVVQFLRMI